MTKAETRPFWMDDEDWDRKYPPMPQVNVAEKVAAGVPKLEEVEKGDIIGAYTIKDGLLIYHFYKKDRKEIYDAAHAEMDKIGDEVTDSQERTLLQDAAAAKANASLEEHPWWPIFGSALDAVFSETFKYQEYKATFYREVDSWSVMLPEPFGVVSANKQQLEKPFAMLALRVGAK